MAIQPTLAAANGDLPRAVELFGMAAGAGMEAAARERERIDAIMNRPSVTYLIQPSSK